MLIYVHTSACSKKRDLGEKKLHLGVLDNSTFTKYHCEHVTNICLPGDYYVVMHVNCVQDLRLNLFVSLDPQSGGNNLHSEITHRQCIADLS